MQSWEPSVPGFSFARKKRLLVDVDLTIVNPIPKWINWLVDKTGYLPDQLIPVLDGQPCSVDYDITKYWDRVGWYGVKPEGFDPFDFWREKHLYDDMPEIEGAVNTLNYLHTLGWEIVAVSHCKGYSMYSKVKWLKERIPLEGFIATKEKHLVHGDVIVDDRLNNLVTSPCPTKVLFPSVYKQSISDTIESNIIRVTGWVEIKRRLEGL